MREFITIRRVSKSGPNDPRRLLSVQAPIVRRVDQTKSLAVRLNARCGLAVVQITGDEAWNRIGRGAEVSTIPLEDFANMKLVMSQARRGIEKGPGSRVELWPELRRVVCLDGRASAARAHQRELNARVNLLHCPGAAGIAAAQNRRCIANVRLGRMARTPHARQCALAYSAGRNSVGKQAEI